MIEEKVVLVDEDNNVLGEMDKALVHTANTPLHRAFSIFIFNPQGELLVQQRSHYKKTWPLIWSNSVCGHQFLHESIVDTIRRRVLYELGLELKDIHEILPKYRYRVEKYGVVENEICPVFVSFTQDKPQVNPIEVEAIQWIPWYIFLTTMKDPDLEFSAWSIEEAELLAQNQHFQMLLNEWTK